MNPKFSDIGKIILSAPHNEPFLNLAPKVENEPDKP